MTTQDIIVINPHQLWLHGDLTITRDSCGRSSESNCYCTDWNVSEVVHKYDQNVRYLTYVHIWAIYQSYKGNGPTRLYPSDLIQHGATN